MEVSDWIIQVVALALTALILPGLKISSLFSLVGLVFIISLTNSLIWDAALFYQIPDSLTSQALLTVAANGLFFFVLVRVLPGVECAGIGTAIISPILFSILTVTLSRYGKEINWNLVGQTAMDLVNMVKSSLLAPS